MNTQDVPTYLDRRNRNQTANDTTNERKALDVEKAGDEDCQESRLSLRERLKHFTWAWFTCTMGGGGTAILLAEQPHKFHGLYTIGVIAFIFNIVVFLTFCTAMALRAAIDPKRFLKTFTHPSEAFFFGSFWLSIASILGGIQLYGITYGPAGTWLVDAIRVLYWIYAAFSICNAVQQYFLFMWITPRRPLPFNPSWFLPNYSSMLTGTIAALIADSQPPVHRMPILISGLALQGLGWMVCLVLLTVYFYRMMEDGLPPPSLRPGMFIPVGSGSYTIVALIVQAQAIPRDYGYFAKHLSAVDTLQTMALFTGIFLWVFMFWLFAIATLSCLSGIRNMSFTLTWWGMIFPNVGFVIATIEIGKQLNSEGIMWLGSVMTILLVALWLFTWVNAIRAVWRKKIMSPGKDEDKGL
ncbi:voltage-dependent anion channel [Lophiotrema nucula]|uniref:Voltage-dependent anion channel n=1 Tax=Lophiotrema nucula TaxID=690887 RepID=A0A6A5ZR09_9PLEO|nr:voltage-dependent anion channel [Lophiotrema nucula]